MSEQKRLRRSATDKQLSGVCGGFAKYFDTDPVFIRALFVVITILSGVLPGLLAYIALAIIMPEEQEGTK